LQAAGQNPSTTFISIYRAWVPFCAGGGFCFADKLPFLPHAMTICGLPGQKPAMGTEVHLFYFHFGFIITPNNLTDDYDWQLFDVTGHNVTDV